MDRFLPPNENPSSFLEHLQKRGLVQDFTPAIEEYFKNCQTVNRIPRAYVGFDPSADSLQVGNLMAALLLRRAQLHGIKPLILLGGATGLIGDPSGKKEERTLLDKEKAHNNLEKIKAQLRSLIDVGEGKYQAEFRNNYDWFKSYNYLDFLRDVGKHITINYMTAKDSVKIRMETGISYAEFGYMLIQGYDFLHLFEHDDCRIQLGGSDQWGNVTTGIELIRRKHAKEGYAISCPLLTDSAGNKLGKTESGAIYLDPNKTSPFRFFQFWLQQPDTEVPKLLRFLTLFKDEYIEDLEKQIKEQPEARSAQRILAHELTRTVHGEEAALASDNASKVLFSKDPKVFHGLSDKGLEVLAQEVPNTNLLAGQELSILDLLVETKLCSSKGEARRHLKSGAVTIDRQKISDENLKVSHKSFADRKALLLGVGKSNLHLVLKKI
ncbi:MAG: tyrosine--tRNA ligase [Oligoflexia bacterium]|nr:tyrosine--tRNA ligase [Oligoflexia bacterium]